jgi:hypothetical protein
MFPASLCKMLSCIIKEAKHPVKSTPLAVFAMALAAPGWAVDTHSPFLGKWKYNVGKSHVSSGTVPPRGALVTIERDGAALRWTNVGEVNGKLSKFTYRFQLNGQDYSVIGAPGVYDKMSVREIDPYTWETVSKKDGKVVSTSKRTVSNGGTTLTVVSTPQQSNGEMTRWTQVYDRQ